MDDIFGHALKKQTGVALKYMLDFGANPLERQLMLSAQVCMCARVHASMHAWSLSGVCLFTCTRFPPVQLAAWCFPWVSFPLSTLSCPFRAQFLHKELPVRLAHRVAELENLPYGLSTKSSVLKVWGESGETRVPGGEAGFMQGSWRIPPQSLLMHPGGFRRRRVKQPNTPHPPSKLGRFGTHFRLEPELKGDN